METKSLFQSKTIWGLLIAAAPTVAGLFGYQVSDVAAFTAGSEQLVNELTTLVGLVIAAYGRARATAKLVVKKE